MGQDRKTDGRADGVVTLKAIADLVGLAPERSRRSSTMPIHQCRFWFTFILKQPYFNSSWGEFFHSSLRAIGWSCLLISALAINAPTNRSGRRDGTCCRALFIQLAHLCTVRRFVRAKPRICRSVEHNRFLLDYALWLGIAEIAVARFRVHSQDICRASGVVCSVL
jgi:hypothetical protein